LFVLVHNIIPLVRNSGTATCYLVAPDGRLQELHWFKQSYAAWFIGDFVCSDGSLYIASPVDPIYMILPILEQVRMKKGDDMGKFRALDEIMYVDGFPGYVHLLPVLASCLELICELREVGQDKYYRLDDSKVLAWLCCKVKCTSEALLSSSNKYFSGLSEEDFSEYPVLLIM
jgi:ribonuclease H2 subunit B